MFGSIFYLEQSSKFSIQASIGSFTLFQLLLGLVALMKFLWMERIKLMLFDGCYLLHKFF